MGKAYECDKCGKLMKAPAIIKSSITNKRGEVYYAFVKFYDEEPDEDDFHDLSLTFEICLECAGKVVNGMHILGGE